MATQYRLQLVLYHIADITNSPPPRTIKGLINTVNQTYKDLLASYTDHLIFYGLIGESRERLNTDADVERHLATVGPSPTFEVLLSEEVGAKFMRGVVDELHSLRRQVAEGGGGTNPAYGLLSRIAVVDDARATEILRNEANAGNIVKNGMRSSPDCAFMQSQGTRAMDLWTTDVPDHFREVGVEPVIRAMRTFPEDILLQSRGMHFLGQAALRHPDFIAEIHSLQGYIPIIEAMRRWPMDPDVQRYGSWALGALLGDPARDAAIVQAGGIPALLNCIRNFPGDDDICQHAASALMALAENPDYAAQIIQNDGAAIIGGSLEVVPDGDGISVPTRVQLLSNLAMHEPLRKDLGVAIPSVLTAMSNRPGDAALQESGLRFLARLALRDPAVQEEILRLNGVPLIANALRQATEPGLTAAGVRLAANLCHSPQGRAALHKSMGVETVLRAMANFPQSSETQEWGCRCLALLAQDAPVRAEILRLMGVEAILKAMRQFPREGRIQINGAYALGMLAGADEVKVKIGNLGGLEVLISVLRTPMAVDKDRGPSVEQACACIAILCELDSNKRLLLNCGGLQAVADVLLELNDSPKPFKQIAKLIALVAVDEESAEIFRTDSTLGGLMTGMEVVMHEPDSLYYAMKAISNICERAETAEYDIPARLLDLVLQAMRTYPQDVKLLESGLECIAIMARKVEFEDRVRTEGAIVLTCEIMKAHSTSMSVSRKGCRAIANIASTELNQAAVREAQGLHIVINAIQFHASHPEVGEQGCAALANLAHDPENRRAIVLLKGIDAILHSLRSHGQHPGIQAYGLGALGNLAVDDDNRGHILTAGAIDMVVRAMGEWQRDPRVQHFSCLALSNFAIDDKNKIAIGRAGGIGLVLAAMKNLRAHPGVQEQACGALANIGSLDQNLVEIAAKGGIEDIIDALRAHLGNEAVAENAVFALSKFMAKPSEEYRRRMTQAALAPLLDQVLESKPAFDVKVAAQVLKRRLTSTYDDSTLPTAPPAPMQGQNMTGPNVPYPVSGHPGHTPMPQGQPMQGPPGGARPVAASYRGPGPNMQR